MRLADVHVLAAVQIDEDVDLVVFGEHVLAAYTVGSHRRLLEIFVPASIGEKHLTRYFLRQLTPDWRELCRLDLAKFPGHAPLVLLVCWGFGDPAAVHHNIQDDAEDYASSDD